MSKPSQEMSALLRVSRLPLISSLLQSVTSSYTEVKGRYALLRLVGGATEIGMKTASLAAVQGATPLLQSLAPQIEAANSFALIGLDYLERNFPVLHQSSDEAVAHLKDAFFLTLDDVQLWVVDRLGGTLDQLQTLLDTTWTIVQVLQESQFGQAMTSGVDEILSRLEDGTAYYLPIPPTLRRDWELMMQQYEDEDEDQEPSLWTRFRTLLLNLSLQLYYRLSKLREQLDQVVRTLGDIANKVGLGLVLELVGDLLQFLKSFMVSLLNQLQSLMELTLTQVKGQMAVVLNVLPLRQVQELPAQTQQVLRDLQELSKTLLQLLINMTPLYTMLQQPTAQEVEDFLSQEDFMVDKPARHSSASSLFLKAMDGQPRRRRSLYSRVARGAASASPNSPGGRRASLKQEAVEAEGQPLPSGGTAHRRLSAAELLVTPLKQLVSQSQKAFEYLNPGSSTPVKPEQPDHEDGETTAEP